MLRVDILKSSEVKLSQFYAELNYLVYISIGRIKHESQSVYKSLIPLANCPQTLYLVWNERWARDNTTLHV